MVVPENGTVPLDTTSRTKETLLEHRHTDILSILRTCASSSTSIICRSSSSSAQYQNPPLCHAFANSVHPSPLLLDVVSHTLRGRRRSFGCYGSVTLCPRRVWEALPAVTTSDATWQTTPSSCREGAAYKQGQGAAP
jgi:hypothetical protein